MVKQSSLPAFAQVAVFNAFFDTNEERILSRPELFYKAAGESIALLLATCWLITYIARPISPETGKVVWEGNALKNRIGYNNLCVGFDMQPALTFAMLCWIPISYLGLKFAVQDALRTRLTRDRLSGGKICFSILTDLWYGTSFIGFMLTFAVHPWDNVWGHTIGFLNLAIAQWFVCVANIYEGDHATTGSGIFCVVYGLITIANFGLILSNYVYYERTGHGPWEPWWIGCFFDYAWFMCLPLTTIFMPNAEAIDVSCRIVDPEAIGSVSEEVEKSTGNVLTSQFTGYTFSPTLGLFGGEEDADDYDEEEEDEP